MIDFGTRVVRDGVAVGFADTDEPGLVHVVPHGLLLGTDRDGRP